MELQIKDFTQKITPYFEDGKIGMLAGAGISIASGIPDALTIIKIIMQQLECEESDIKAFFSIKSDDDRGELPIAFEALIGTIENHIEFVNTQNDFLTLFSQNFEALPTQNHYFWTNLFKNQKLHFIATTNFDTCFEQALQISPLSEDIICSYPNEYEKLNNTQIEGKIIKLHGSMVTPSNIGTTIDQINNKHNIRNIDALVEKIFKQNTHHTIILVGYSCSDVMDITPKIQSIGYSLEEREKVQVIYWQYKRNGNVFEWDYLKNAQETNDIIKVKNAFRNYDNAILVSGDLSVFIENYYNIKPTFYNGTFKVDEKIDNPMLVLGALFRDAGMYEIAIKYFKKELERVEFLNNIDTDNKRAVIYRYLGDVYGLNDEIDNSLNILKKAVIILLKSKVADKIELAELYYSLSESYEDKGLIQKAIRTAEKAVNIYLEVYNDENYPELAKIYSTLGEFYYKNEQPKIGLEYCKKSLRIRLSLFSEKHPYVANTYVNMGCCYSAMGKQFYDMAQICHEKSLEIRKNVYGLYHERVAQSYNNVGHIHYRKKEYTLALTHYQKAFEVYDKSPMGFDHYLVAATYENIGLVYYEQGEDKEALSYYFAAYQTYHKIFKDDTTNYNFARLFYNIANACIGLEEYQKAKECLDSALEVAKNINLPTNDSFYVDVKKSLEVLEEKINVKNET